MSEGLTTSASEGKCLPRWPHTLYDHAVSRIIDLMKTGALPNGGFHPTFESAQRVVNREGQGRVLPIQFRGLPTVYLYTLEQETCPGESLDRTPFREREGQDFTP